MSILFVHKKVGIFEELAQKVNSVKLKFYPNSHFLQILQSLGPEITENKRRMQLLSFLLVNIKDKVVDWMNQQIQGISLLSGQVINKKKIT